MRNAKHDDLAVQQIRESIAIRLESFGSEFKRLAITEQQFILAGRFNDAVQDVNDDPLIAAHVQQLAEWLTGYGDQFERTASTVEQKRLADSFKVFIAEVGSPAVKDVFQRPLVNELIEEIQSGLAEGHTNGFPIAWLSNEDKKEFLSIAIDWTDYINRGLELEPKTADHIGRIIDNAIAGKPSEQWWGPAEPVAVRFEDILNRQSGQPEKAFEKEKHRGIDR